MRASLPRLLSPVSFFALSLPLPLLSLALCLDLFQPLQFSASLSLHFPLGPIGHPLFTCTDGFSGSSES